jgi:hypothetical protein
MMRHATRHDLDTHPHPVRRLHGRRRVQPRAGLALTAAVIVIDVAVNACAGLAYGFDRAAFGAQMLFLVVVLATLRPAWRGVKINACATTNVQHNS